MILKNLAPIYGLKNEAIGSIAIHINTKVNEKITKAIVHLKINDLEMSKKISDSKLRDILRKLFGIS